MEMLITILATCSLGMILCVLAITGTGSRQEPRPESEGETGAGRTASDFFVNRESAAPRPRIPAEVLRNRIERHVRSEQRAAERFLEIPTVESLHSAASRFLN